MKPIAMRFCKEILVHDYHFDISKYKLVKTEWESNVHDRKHRTYWFTFASKTNNIMQIECQVEFYNGEVDRYAIYLHKKSNIFNNHLKLA